MSAERPCLIALGLLVWGALVFFGLLGGTCQFNSPFSFSISLADR